jgi:hypothetical protein
MNTILQYLGEFASMISIALKSFCIGALYIIAASLLMLLV